MTRLTRIARARLLASGALCLLGGTAAAATHTYTYQLIVVPGAKQTDPIAVNASGTVLGYWDDKKYNQHGYLYQGGTITKFDVPHATSTVPTGMDDTGDVVGAYQDTQGNHHGFIRSAAGAYTTVDLPGSAYNALSAINQKGVAVGVGLDSSSNLEIFTYDTGVFTTIVDNGMSPIPVAINSHGAVAGYYEPPRARESSFLYKAGTITPIPLKNAQFVQSFAINAKGVVVGQAVDGESVQVGFVYAHGRTRTYLAPGAASTYFDGINDTGVISGAAFDSSNNPLGGVVLDHGDFSFLNVPNETGTGALGINNSGQVIGNYVDSNGAETFLATPTN
jgi:hypothetical protein